MFFFSSLLSEEGGSMLGSIGDNQSSYLVENTRATLAAEAVVSSFSLVVCAKVGANAQSDNLIMANIKQYEHTYNDRVKIERCNFDLKGKLLQCGMLFHYVGYLLVCACVCFFSPIMRVNSLFCFFCFVLFWKLSLSDQKTSLTSRALLSVQGCVLHIRQKDLSD